MTATYVETYGLKNTITKSIMDSFLKHTYITNPPVTPKDSGIA